jgi:hypothetical protein
LIVRGRVVGAEGKPVAGARVWLDNDCAAMPAVGQARAGRHGALEELTDSAGKYVFSVTSHPGLAQLREPALCAVRGQQVSRKVVLDWRDQPVVAPDLVLRAGVVGRVRVLLDDGSAASGASVEITISEHAPEGADPRAGLHSFEGTTDERGELSFGPVADVEYQRIAVKATHPDAPVRWLWWDGVRVSPTDPIEFSLTRGRTVRGRLLTPEGEPAVGYRLAAWSGETGDPHAKQAVTADADGRFEVRGVGAAIAVYAAVPRPAASDLVARARARFAAVFLGHPLLIRDVPTGCDDLGPVSIPTLGTLTVRFDDEHGAPVRNASAWWHRAGIIHGGSGCRSSADGILRADRVPLGIAIVLCVTFEHPQHGEMEQSFKIPEVTEEAIPLRLTGAGTVIFRLHPAGSPEQPLTVSCVSFGEHEHHGAARDGSLSELHWWTWPGFYPSLMVEAKGFRRRVIENVTVRDDGPTFLDVELEPIQ